MATTKRKNDTAQRRCLGHGARRPVEHPSSVPFSRAQRTTHDLHDVVVGNQLAGSDGPRYTDAQRRVRRDFRSEDPSDRDVTLVERPREKFRLRPFPRAWRTEHHDIRGSQWRYTRPLVMQSALISKTMLVSGCTNLRSLSV